MIRKLSILSAAICGFTAFSAAQAATITYTTSAALSDVDLDGFLTAPQFDPTLGMLTGVSWSITGEIASILGVSNDGASPVTGMAFVTVDFDLESLVLSLGASPDFTLVGSTGSIVLAPGESALFPVTGLTTITGTEAVSSTFIGTSSLDVLYLTITSFGANGFGGDITVSQATDAGVSLTITYDYDPTVIPLPAAAPLMAAGLGVIGAISARRRRKNA